MGIRIDTRQPTVLIVVLSFVIVIAAIVVHFMPPLRSAPWLTQYHFWIAIVGYALLLWRTVF